MMFISKIFGLTLFLLLSVTISVLGKSFHLMGEIKLRDSFKLIQDAPYDKVHEIVVAIPQNNIPVIESMLLDRANPSSPNYQQWLSFEEIGNLVKNEEATSSVYEWVKSIPGGKITWQSEHGEYLKVEAPVASLEEVLNTKFHYWEDTTQSKHAKSDGNPIYYIRSKHYSIPNAMKQYIAHIFNTVQVPPEFHPRYQSKTKEHVSHMRVNTESLNVASNSVTVSFLNSLYHIPSNLGNGSLSQSVFETSSEYFSPTDLTTFQRTFGLTVQAAQSVGGHSLSTACSSSTCGEGNLDIQYLMGVAQMTSSIFWYVSNSNSDPFLSWITTMADSANPPQANSISWGSNEFGVDPSTLSQFNTEAIKLTSRGVTITVSSGDNGVADVSNSGTCLCNSNSGNSALHYQSSYSWSGKGYFPSFPATNPYVTAVGATMGPNYGDPEIACQANKGGVITSGGGFSTYYARPSYQTEAVDSYFSGLNFQPSSGFNRNGRAYPDVSLIGVSYAVVINNNLQYFYGTSCSAPVFAAFISLINALRLQSGLTSVGFVNPTLYAGGYNTSVTYFDDVTVGDNHCCANNDYPTTPTVCCQSGFNTSTGWDPVSGWGSIKFTSLSEMLKVTVSYTPPSSSSHSYPFLDYFNSLTMTERILLVVAIISFFVTVVSFMYRCFCRRKSSRAPRGGRNGSLNNAVEVQNVAIVPSAVAVPIQSQYR